MSERVEQVFKLFVLALAVVMVVWFFITLGAYVAHAQDCRVVDGDTIACPSERIRIKAIDTPERGERGFDEATAALADLLPGSTCEDTGGRTYGRIVARCATPDGLDIGAELVRTGHACWWERYGGAVYRELGERCAE